MYANFLFVQKPSCLITAGTLFCRNVFEVIPKNLQHVF